MEMKKWDANGRLDMQQKTCYHYFCVLSYAYSRMIRPPGRYAISFRQVTFGWQNRNRRLNR